MTYKIQDTFHSFIDPKPFFFSHYIQRLAVCDETNWLIEIIMFANCFCFFSFSFSSFLSTPCRSRTFLFFKWFRLVHTIQSNQIKTESSISLS